MKTSIELNRIRFFSYHGVAEQERRVGNDYEVSLRVDYPLERAMESDSLCDTLDYAALYALVAAEMSVPSQLPAVYGGRFPDGFLVWPADDCALLSSHHRFPER